VAKKKSISIINTYLATFQSLKTQPKLVIPFACFAFVELIFLLLIYVAPRQPFNIVLAPPIRAFWGERFLHYPVNFLLLPKLASHSRNFLSCIIGSLLTGFAVAMVADTYNSKTVHLFSALKNAFRKYLSLFTVVLIINLLFLGLVKVMEMGLIRYFTSGHATLLFLKPVIWLGPILIALNLLLVVLVQGVFVYAIPLLMIENLKLFKAIGRSALLFVKLFLPTLALVGLPVLIYIPIIILQFNAPFLIDRLFPESVLYVCIAAVVINSLVIDLLVTLSTTILFLQNKK